MKPQYLPALLLLLAACRGYHPSPGKFEHLPPLVPTPPPSVQQGAGAKADATGATSQAGLAAAQRTAPVAGAAAGPGEERPNPVTVVGQGATQTVGRSFDPVYFDFDSAELRFAARRTLKDYAEWLIEHLDVWVVLEGHCDSTGSGEYNYNLGMARAWAVKDGLVGLGVGDARLFTISYGEDRPAVEEVAPEPEDLDKQRAQNRRVQFLAFIAPAGGKTPQPAGPASPPPDLMPPPAAPEAKEVP